MNSALTVSGVAKLPYFGCIRASGAEATAFLQSQLTSDFSSLRPTRAQLAGFCSAKGRLQASFIGWKVNETDVVLICAADLLAATLKRLSMFILRMKCKLSDATSDLPVFGLAGASAEARLDGASAWECRDSPEGTAIRLPAAHGQALALWLPRSGTGTAVSEPPIGQDEWRRLLIASGVPVVEAKTVDLFVPQMINFELLGGVNFQKGCYPGQEVVARSQYRGTLKRRMFLFDCDAQAVAGQEVFNAQDPAQPAGVIANAAVRPDGHGSTVLVELRLSELQRGSLHLGSPAGPALARRELPYDVPLPSTESS
jgi:tRNA-modifying protein YgfZ